MVFEVAQCHSAPLFQALGRTRYATVISGRLANSSAARFLKGSPKRSPECFRASMPWQRWSWAACQSSTYLALPRRFFFVGDFSFYLFLVFFVFSFFLLDFSFYLFCVCRFASFRNFEVFCFICVFEKCLKS